MMKKVEKGLNLVISISFSIDLTSFLVNFQTFFIHLQLLYTIIHGITVDLSQEVMYSSLMYYL